MKKALWMILVGLLVGCTSPLAISGMASLTLALHVEEGGFRTQAVPVPYTKASINHILLKLFTVTGGVEAGSPVATSDLTSDKLDTSVTFDHLKANTTYRIRCYAYKAAGTSPFDLISTTDSSSYTDLVVTNDDRPTLASIPVKLIDVPFIGQGTDSIVVTDGLYLPIGTLSMGVQASDSLSITTIAGNGSAAFAGDGGYMALAQVNNPSGLALDGLGNLYIAEKGDHRVRKIATDGTITTVAGNGSAAYAGDGGLATAAQLSGPQGVAVDASGSLYIADSGNHCIRKVGKDGKIATVAGNGTPGSAGDGGLATAAQLNNPQGVAVDSAGNLYIADSSNHRVRKVGTDGKISTLAGNGTPGFGGDNGSATAAQLSNPSRVAVDGAGNLYIADSGNNRIRKVSSGNITTFAGGGGALGDGGPATAAQLSAPTDVALDGAGNLYITDSGNNRIRKVMAGNISTLAGTGAASFGGDGGLATAGVLNGPNGLAVDLKGLVFITDYANQRIRMLY